MMIMVIKVFNIILFLYYFLFSLSNIVSCTPDEKRKTPEVKDDRPIWEIDLRVINQIQIPKVELPDDRPSWNIIEENRILTSTTQANTGVTQKDKFFDSTVSKKKCRQFCRFPYTVTPALFVQGGEDAKPHEFPHMAALGYANSQGSSLDWSSCGGSLISDTFVLTAAHCVGSSLGPPKQVRLGDHDVSSKRDGAQHKDFNVVKIIVHPNYKSQEGLYNDIALLQLEKPINITREIKPACLHNTGVEINQAVATGWGTLGFGGSPSDILQKVTLDIVSNLKCKALLGSDSSIPRGIIDSQLCSGILVGGHDTCVGDSGGPLQVNSTMFPEYNICPMEIIGVTSFGKFCGEVNSPGVYTRVSDYLPWIESIVWPGEKI